MPTAQALEKRERRIRAAELPFAERAAFLASLPTVAEFVNAYQACLKELTHPLRERIAEADLKPTQHNAVLDILVKYMSGRSRTIRTLGDLQKEVGEHLNSTRRKDRRLQDYLFSREMEVMGNFIGDYRRLRGPKGAGQSLYACLLNILTGMQREGCDGNYTNSYQGHSARIGEIQLSERWLFEHLPEVKRPRFSVRLLGGEKKAAA